MFHVKIRCGIVSFVTASPGRVVMLFVRQCPAGSSVVYECVCYVVGSLCMASLKTCVIVIRLA